MELSPNRMTSTAKHTRSPATSCLHGLFLSSATSLSFASKVIRTAHGRTVPNLVTLYRIGHTVPNRSHCTASVTLYRIGHTVPNRSHRTKSVTPYRIGHTVPNRSHCTKSVTPYPTGHTVPNRSHRTQSGHLLWSACCCFMLLAPLTSARHVLPGWHASFEQDRCKSTASRASSKTSKQFFSQKQKCFLTSVGASVWETEGGSAT
eukprot:363309-Chlamydomonas_euryale.AAC.6